MRHGTAIGIDFGTTNSSAAIYDGQSVRLLPIDRHGEAPEVVKTILYITRDGKQSIGEEAVQNYQQDNISRARRFVKKWVGEISYRGGDMFYVTDVYAYVDELAPGRLLQYLKTALRMPGYGGTSVFGQRYSAEDLATVYLRALKERVEALLERPVKRAVLGRPVHMAGGAGYSGGEADAQVEGRLVSAARRAGFVDVQLELEPVAAALEYGSRISRAENVLVFDFGGGTLDITVIRIGDKEARVFSTGGIDVAGSNFDSAIVGAKLLAHFAYGTHYGQDKRPFPRDIVEQMCDWQTLAALGTLEMKGFFDRVGATSDHPARVENLESLIFNEYGYSLYSQVEQAKIRLSNEYAAAIELQGEGISVWQMLTRAQFEAIITDYRRQVEDCLLETVRASGLGLEQIDRVVATGGSSSIPSFSQMLAALFGPAKLVKTSVFTSVTAGLAIKAYELFR
ncbi:MAG: Hsp70 family protein [Thermoflexales bacterium]|nr:Hsp70 family protein [Thermoflexales bacterium]